MKKAYGKAAWTHLREYATWMPGSDIRLGDYGVIEESCFKRVGNLSDLVAWFPHDTRESSLDKIFFMSNHGVKGGIVASDKSLGEVEISFSKANGVVFTAKDVVSRTASVTKELALRLANSPFWNRSYKLVTNVRSAGAFGVIIASSSNSKLKISAEEGVLAEFLTGGVSAGASISVSGVTSLEMLGKSGPVSVGLHSLRLFGGGFRNLMMGDEQKKEVRLVPYVAPIEELEE